MMQYYIIENKKLEWNNIEKKKVVTAYRGWNQLVIDLCFPFSVALVVVFTVTPFSFDSVTD